MGGDMKIQSIRDAMAALARRHNFAEADAPLTSTRLDGVVSFEDLAEVTSYYGGMYRDDSLYPGLWETARYFLDHPTAYIEAASFDGNPDSLSVADMRIAGFSVDDQYAASFIARLG
jgi:hypothetical protein